MGPLLDVLTSTCACLFQQLVFSGRRRDPDSDDDMAQEDLCYELFGDYLSGVTLSKLQYTNKSNLFCFDDIPIVKKNKNI